jgi:hypothetical protein
MKIPFFNQQPIIHCDFDSESGEEYYNWHIAYLPSEEIYFENEYYY